MHMLKRMYICKNIHIFAKKHVYLRKEMPPCSQETCVYAEGMYICQKTNEMAKSDTSFGLSFGRLSFGRRNGEKRHVFAMSLLAKRDMASQCGRCTFLLRIRQKTNEISKRDMFREKKHIFDQRLTYAEGDLFIGK